MFPVAIATLARLLVDYMQAVRWLHIACEVFAPQTQTEPWYTHWFEKWKENHQRMIDDLTALSRNMDWHGLMDDMKRAECWSPRFEQLEDGRIHVPDRVR